MGSPSGRSCLHLERYRAVLGRFPLHCSIDQSRLPPGGLDLRGYSGSPGQVPFREVWRAPAAVGWTSERALRSLSVSESASDIAVMVL